MCIVSAPKQQAIPPVIQRQAFKQPAPFGSYASGAGKVPGAPEIVNPNGAQGDTSVASTTRNPLGSQVLGGGSALPLGGGGSSSSGGSVTGTQPDSVSVMPKSSGGRSGGAVVKNATPWEISSIVANRLGLRARIAKAV